MLFYASFVFTSRFSLTLTMMAESNICRSPSRKAVCLMELLVNVWILLASEVAPEVSPNYEAVDDLMINAQAPKIQSDITELHVEHAGFSCHQYPVYSGDCTKTAVFVWASEQKTHAMRNCLYQEMERIGKMDITSVLQLAPRSTFELCNRSVDISIMPYFFIDIRIPVLCLYVNDTESYGRVVVKPTITFDTISSRMNVYPPNYVGSRVQTIVCNSIEVTPSKTGKLRQTFFSVVGNSEEEVIVKSRRNGSASVTLDFDVLALNSSRIGLLNDSDVELFFLSFITVSCRKVDQYGLNDETNEIVVMHETGVVSKSIKTVIIKDKLRIRVNVSIRVVSDHNFGKYVCVTDCRLQKKKDIDDMRDGCRQTKYFSVVLDNWREEIMLYRQHYHYCVKNITHNNEILFAIFEDATKKCVKRFEEFADDITKLFVEKVKEIRNWLFEVYMDLALREILIATQYSIMISTIGVPIIIIIIYVICKSIRRELDIRRDAKLFIDLLTKARDMENNNNRTLRYDIYLSYSSKDRPWVQSTLLKFIESKGFKVCFDERDFPLGCNVPRTIENAVFESRKAIAVLSPNYMKSGWYLDYEYVLMLTKILNKEASHSSLLLIKYRDCQLLDSMKSMKYLDYTKAHDDNGSVVMRVLRFMFPFLEFLEMPGDETQFLTTC